jgi:hypothetical protein
MDQPPLANNTYQPLDVPTDLGDEHDTRLGEKGQHATGGIQH